ncbi:NIPSNAP family protein [Paenibacillus albus]|uniref:NIPSNAP family protein n=1 Tax=Paenibacillus albus TaxID=2495582 RepID=A0A3S9A6B3_9BACL|nr:NIPSNAP family protein [Paenibacillus albus]AZN41268.1 NIPSNAP family protein [Paenibacillus albus]
MIYELRVYDMHPGKMKAIQERFDNHVIALFAKHGMKITHFWADLDEAKNRLYYIVEHDSLELRNENYERFRSDPEWIELRRVTEQNGPLVLKQESFFMQDVAFFTNK